MEHTGQYGQPVSAVRPGQPGCQETHRYRNGCRYRRTGSGSRSVLCRQSVVRDSHGSGRKIRDRSSGKDRTGILFIGLRDTASYGRRPRCAECTALSRQRDSGRGRGSRSRYTEKGIGDGSHFGRERRCSQGSGVFTDQQSRRQARRSHFRHQQR